MQETRESNLLSVAQVARRLNVSKPTVYRRIWEGQIPALRIGEEIGPLRVPADELADWLDERRNVGVVSSPPPRPQTPAAHVRDPDPAGSRSRTQRAGEER
jgi:excisionase family DNA binding protein